MARLDMSDVLTDPDFTDHLICTRLTQTVTTGGLGLNVPSNFSFFGVVTPDTGNMLERLAEGERIAGSISVVTKFRLIDGVQGLTADIVTWRGRQYTVAKVNDFSNFGQGFIEASCDLAPLQG